MIHGILAHAGGLDEMGIILFPIVVGGAVWVLTRTPGSPNKPKLPRIAPTDQKSKPVFVPADRKTKPPRFS
jgi:hypothetical protein